MFEAELKVSIKKLAEGDGYYDVGGGEMSLFQYATHGTWPCAGSSLAADLASRSTIVDEMDEAIGRAEDGPYRRLVSKGYIEANMAEYLDLEPKSGVILKDSLCHFDTEQAYKNILCMTATGGMIIIIDGAPVIDAFMDFAMGRVSLVHEFKYPFCNQCGGFQNECECDTYSPYAYAILVKNPTKYERTEKALEAVRAVLNAREESDMTPRERWEADMCWVFKAPHVVGNCEQVCPVWGDKLPYKSVTVTVSLEDEEAAAYCLESAHGGQWTRRKVHSDGTVSLRSNYVCW